MHTTAPAKDLIESLDDTKYRRERCRLGMVSCIHLLLLLLLLFALIGKWYHQHWTVANGSVMEWHITLWSGDGKVDCDGEQQEYRFYCHYAFVPLNSSIRVTSTLICNYLSITNPNSHIHMALRPVCHQIRNLAFASTLTGSFIAVSFGLLVVSFIALLAHWHAKMTGKVCYFLAFFCLLFSWISCVVGVSFYASRLHLIQQLFALGGGKDHADQFAPYVVKPLHHEWGYGLGIASAFCVLGFLHLICFSVSVKRHGVAWQSWYGTDGTEKLVGSSSVHNYGV